MELYWQAAANNVGDKYHYSKDLCLLEHNGA